MNNKADKKYHSHQITHRFLKAVDVIIGTKDKAGKIITKSILAQVIAMSSSNINRLRSSGANIVTVEAIGCLCKHYKVSAQWLVTGEGEMFNTKDVKTIETRIKSLEDVVKNLKKSK